MKLLSDNRQQIAKNFGGIYLSLIHIKMCIRDSLIPAGHTVSSDIRNSASCDTTDLHENAMLKQAPAVDHPQGNN